jgi:hypothetical protein
MRTRAVLGGATLFLAPALPAGAQCELQRIEGVAPLELGSTFALSGDLAVVPAGLDGETVLQMLRRADGGTPDVPDDDVWSLAEVLAAPPGERFVSVCAHAGDVLVVKGPGVDEGEGEAFVYVRDGDQWLLGDHLRATPPGWHDGFGSGLALAGDTLLVAAPSDSFCGVQYAGSLGIYARDRKDTRDPRDDEWVETQRICHEPPLYFGWFGGSPAIAGDLLAVTQPAPVTLAGGAVVLYARRANDPLDALDDVWGEVDRVVNPEPTSAGFGADTALSRDHLVVAAPAFDGGGTVFVYTRRERGVPDDPGDDEWVETARLRAPAPQPGDGYGRAVALSGDRILVGWPEAEDAGEFSGVAHLWRRVDSGVAGDLLDDTWELLGVLHSGASRPGARFGWDVALESATALIGGGGRIHSFSAQCMPVPATVTTRNGSGANPAVLAARTLPLLGSTWQAEVATASLPGASATVLFARALALPGTPTPFGELLVGGAELGRSVAAPSSGLARHALALPADPALLGVDVHVQALVLGGGARLTNALDLVLGL